MWISLTKTLLKHVSTHITVEESIFIANVIFLIQIMKKVTA